MPLKTVISASRRTDIPAFYLDWFTNHIREGRILLENPRNPHQTRTVSLHPDRVKWIVFWSRNYAHFLKKHRFFSDYRLFFHFTILPASLFDRHTPKVSTALAQMEKLAGMYTPETIIWRYDPLIFWEEKGAIHSNHDPGIFYTLCKEIGAMGVRRCYTSLVHPYQKFLKRLDSIHPGIRLREPADAGFVPVVHEMIDTARAFDIRLFSCCTESLEAMTGIEPGRCIDGRLLNRLSGSKQVSEARMATRPGCGCTRSIDIGDYCMHTCPFGCLYCYANPRINRTPTL